MDKQITFRQIEWLLGHVGFVREPTSGRHNLFVHRPTDAMIVLPPYDPDHRVWAPHLAGVQHTLVWRGIVDETDFEALLEEATTPTPVPSD